MKLSEEKLNQLRAKYGDLIVNAFIEIYQSITEQEIENEQEKELIKELSKNLPN